MTAKPKVLLIYPGNKTWGFTYPMGLLYVANALQKDGIEVSLLHLGTGTLDDLKKDDYLFVGMTMMVGEMVGKGLEAARLVKANNPATPIVLGGVYPSILPEQVLANPLIDIAVIGEGEETARELAAALLSGADLGGVKGLAYKSGGSVVTTPARELLDLETLDQDLPYNLLGDIFTKSTVVPIHTSRGCPYRCAFCYSPLFNKRRYRFKSARKVVDEIEFIVNKYGIRNFNFDYEDEFLVNTDRAVEIFEDLLRRGLKIRWTAFCRFDSFCSARAKHGDRFIKLLKDSGCFYLSFGAESGSQRLLDEVIKKDITVEQIISTSAVLRDHQLIHRVSFINCFPGETRADLEETFKVIDRISEGNRYLALGLFNLIPLPKTAIMERLQRDHGYVPPATMEGWADHIPTRRESVTWHTKEHADFCFAASRMANNSAFNQDFRSYAEYKDFIRTSSGAYPGGYPAYLVARLQRFRYKRRWFYYNVEVIVFAWVRRYAVIATNFVVNSILKKYLSDSAFAALKRFFGKDAWAAGGKEDGGAGQ